jgi:aryl-alcohol dehydrogenase-like predicted oxidoreductase
MSMTADVKTGLDRRPLGRSGLSIAPLVFGGNVFGWTADAATSYRLLDAFMDAGFNAIDTAEAYSSWVPGHTGGESETVIGDWLQRRGRRDDVVICTKVGWHSGDKPGLLTAANIARGCDDSLKRLKTDYIDLYQSHSDDPQTPLEETLGAHARLIEQGKVRAIGCSNYSAARLKEALEISARLGLPRYESVQPPYNLHQREGFEAELAPLCQAEGVGAITYYALAAGFLSGKYRTEADRSKSPRGGGMDRFMNERGFRILAALDEVAGDHGVPLAQVAIAWVMHRPAVTAPIASATSLEQFKDLAAAARLTLSAEDKQRLDAASAY